MEAILKILKLPDQDSSPPCRIITAVTARAASAAADFLSSGDYATAFPASTVLYHGVRQQETSPLTVETTSMLANVLRRSNDAYARELAEKVEDRFTFRYVMARGEFDGIRAAKANINLPDLDCFSELIEKKLSLGGKEVWRKVQGRHERYKDLFDNVLGKKAIKASSTVPQLEADTIKRLVDFELRRNKKSATWSFRDIGIGQLADDFFLFDELISSYGRDRAERWCKRWGKFILPKTDVDEINAITDDKAQIAELVKRARPLLQPLLSFFVALCHALQEGENSLTAVDAYWLGLIDEVVGVNLLSYRNFDEYQPDPPKPTKDEKKEQQTEGAAHATGA